MASPLSQAIDALSADRDELLRRAAVEPDEDERGRLLRESSRLGRALDRLLLGVAIQAAVIASQRLQGARSRRA